MNAPTILRPDFDHALPVDFPRLAASIHSGENGADALSVALQHFTRYGAPEGSTYQIKVREAPHGKFRDDRLDIMRALTDLGVGIVIQSKGKNEEGRGLDPDRLDGIIRAVMHAQREGINIVGFIPGNEPDLDRTIGLPDEHWRTLDRVATQAERIEYWLPRFVVAAVAMAKHAPEVPIWCGAFATVTRMEAWLSALVEYDEAVADQIAVACAHNYQSDPALWREFNPVRVAARALGRDVSVVIDETNRSFVPMPAKDRDGDPIYREDENAYAAFMLATHIEAALAGITAVHDFNLCDAEFQTDAQEPNQGCGYFRFDGEERPAYASHRMMAKIADAEGLQVFAVKDDSDAPNIHALAFTDAQGRRGALLVRADTVIAKTAKEALIWRTGGVTADDASMRDLAYQDRVIKYLQGAPDLSTLALEGFVPYDDGVKAVAGFGAFDWTEDAWTLGPNSAVLLLAPVEV